MSMFNKVVFERTAQVAVAADASTAAAQLITIPTVNNVRPIAFEIADAAANLSVEVSTDPDQSRQIELTAAALLPNAGARRFTLGPSDKIALEAAAGATTADIRWFYPAGAAFSHGAAPLFDGLSLRTLTATLSAVAVESTVSIPDRAVALVIESISAGGAANGLSYRIDDGTANGEKLPLLQGDAITVLDPYIIYVQEDDRLRFERITADATVTGYWLVA